MSTDHNREHSPEMVEAAKEGLRAAEALFFAIKDSAEALPRAVDGVRIESSGEIALRAVVRALEVGMVPPEWAAAAVVVAMRRFDDFEVKSLGEAFDVPNQAHLNARRNERLISAIAHKVAEFQKAGHPLNDSKKGKGALSLAGEHFKMSPKSVEKHRKQWNDLCKELKVDPLAEPEYADSGKVVVEAWIRGWTVE
jgi:hypothetical protein